MALKKVKGTIERAFDTKLQDLVRGIRSCKEDQSEYIAECVEEIKIALKTNDMSVKTNAVNKLIYLQMLGYDISWASFNIVEVMSSSKLCHKRVGFLAASQCFYEGTDVLTLCTNLIRKEFNSSNMYDITVAMSGLACFVTPDLARDLCDDVMILMSSTRPYLRKRAVLLMYRMLLQYPDALRVVFPKFKEKLDDKDVGVQAAVVNVVCELARKNPQNYLSLAPLLFKLLTTSSNNWVLIKIIKLFSAMTTLEPRLGKKLIEPLTNLIHNTSAMSLLYECINTIISVLISLSSGMPHYDSGSQLCVTKLRILIEDSDQNLKYLGLLAMNKIFKANPKAVQNHQDIILQCLEDRDETIRLRALDLLCTMINRRNIMEIVRKLMIHIERAEGSCYRDELLTKIMSICRSNDYRYVTNFEWYFSILTEFSKMEGITCGNIIAEHLMDVTIRVKVLRSFSVREMTNFFASNPVFCSEDFQNANGNNTLTEVSFAAAWICGEYAEFLENPELVLKALLHPSVLSFPAHVQSCLVQNALKIYINMVERLYHQYSGVEADNESYKLQEELLELNNVQMMDGLSQFVHSGQLEVQERAVTIHQLLRHISKLIKRGHNVCNILATLIQGELNPVAPMAQHKVKVPADLDLDAWFNEQLYSSRNDDRAFKHVNKQGGTKVKRQRKTDKHVVVLHGESSFDELPENSVKPEDLANVPVEAKRKGKLSEQSVDPNYLKDVETKSVLLTSRTEQDHSESRALGKQVASVTDQIVSGDGNTINILGEQTTMRPSDKYLLQHREAIKNRHTRKSDKVRGKKMRKTKEEKRSILMVDDDSDDIFVPANELVSSQLDVPEDFDETVTVQKYKQKYGSKKADINLVAPSSTDAVAQRIARPGTKKKSKNTTKSTKSAKIIFDEKIEGDLLDDVALGTNQDSGTFCAAPAAVSVNTAPDQDSMNREKEKALANSSKLDATIPDPCDLDFWLGDTEKRLPATGTDTGHVNVETVDEEDKSVMKLPKLLKDLVRMECTLDCISEVMSARSDLHSHSVKIKQESLHFDPSAGATWLHKHTAFQLVESAERCAILHSAFSQSKQPVYILLKATKAKALLIEVKSLESDLVKPLAVAVRKVLLQNVCPTPSA